MARGIDLTSLSASPGVIIIQGGVAGDKAGRIVAATGDINGNGIDDLIVSAVSGDNGGDRADETYLVFGKAGATRTNIDLPSLATMPAGGAV